MKMNDVQVSGSEIAHPRNPLNRISVFRAVRNGRFLALTAFAVLGLLLAASGAQAAGCSLPFKSAAAPTIPFVSPQGNDRPDVGEDWNGRPAGIVGLWHVNFTAETEAGAPIFPPVPFAFAESFKTWHGDGTEFENAFFAPSGGNICYGVWKDLGDGHVKLHHIGLMFDSTGHLPNIFTDDEKVVVAFNGSTYGGTFDFKLWPPTFEAVGVGTPIAEVTGSVAATRITVD
jgi:hypothetical protein